MNAESISNKAYLMVLAHGDAVENARSAADYIEANITKHPFFPPVECMLRIFCDLAQNPSSARYVTESYRVSALALLTAVPKTVGEQKAGYTEESATER